MELDSEAPRTDDSTVQSSPGIVSTTGINIESITSSEPSLLDEVSGIKKRKLREDILQVVDKARLIGLNVIDRDINAAVNIGICWLYDNQKVDRPGYLSLTKKQTQKKKALRISSEGKYYY